MSTSSDSLYEAGAEQTLESREKAARDVALERVSEDVTRKREAFAGEQAAKLAAFNAASERSLADARARVEATRKARAAKIGPELRAATDPLVDAHCDEPSRKVARAYAEQCLVIMNRCDVEVGEEIHEAALAAAFYARHLKTAGPRVHNAMLDFFGELLPMSRYARTLMSAIKHGGDPAVVSRAMQDLELAVADAVKHGHSAPSELNARKFQIVCIVAPRLELHNTLVAAQREHDQAEAEKRQREFVPPPSLGDRVRGIYGGLPQHAGQR